MVLEIYDNAVRVLAVQSDADLMKLLPNGPVLGVYLDATIPPYATYRAGTDKARDPHILHSLELCTTRQLGSIRWSYYQPQPKGAGI